MISEQITVSICSGGGGGVRSSSRKREISMMAWRVETVICGISLMSRASRRRSW